MSARPAIVWFRRDLRLSDHAALSAAADAGPVIALFIRDEQVDGLGAAPKWRLGEGLAALAQALEARGSRLILRSGGALDVLRAVIAETGAAAVHWQRLYDPFSRKRDAEIKAALRGDGVDAQSHAGHLLQEPWTVATGTGGAYKVFSPFWKAIRGRDPGRPLPVPRLTAPGHWPESERLQDWRLGAAMRRGAAVVARHTRAGEAAAQARLAEFLGADVQHYGEARDALGEDGTSRLSDHLAWGEISSRQAWAAAQRRMEEGAQGTEAFLRQLGWRDFAHHLMFESPHMLERNWREGWEGLGWQEDPEHPHVKAWQEGRTGVALVDAAMRELYVTGRMHNRARMVAASYLTKHLLTHWRVGAAWFADCLTDWDEANNAMGWQWVAGCGPDASPYFRIFNPDGQAEKFDAKGVYRRRWLEQAPEFFEAIPRSWGLMPGEARPEPIVALAEGRARALAAYERLKSGA